ncbi:hypothetical protein R1flu_004925 [Riccia fluitans]|uniref:Uncharacterized protein n=1 Tax=Riccia fluitans TaxID=41844 RepID=A0ABD1YRQ0_9MARC
MQDSWTVISETQSTTAVPHQYHDDDLQKKLLLFDTANRSAVASINLMYGIGLTLIRIQQPQSAFLAQ